MPVKGRYAPLKPQGQCVTTAFALVPRLRSAETSTVCPRLSRVLPVSLQHGRVDLVEAMLQARRHSHKRKKPLSNDDRYQGVPDSLTLHERVSLSLFLLTLHEGRTIHYRVCHFTSTLLVVCGWRDGCFLHRCTIRFLCSCFFSWCGLRRRFSNRPS